MVSGTTPYPRLFSPTTLRARDLRNRIVLTAHTTSLGQDGIPGSRAMGYYCARARGGAGLIVLEPLPVLPSAGVTPQNYRFEDPRFVPALRELVAALHGHGSLVIQQLYHLGRNADPDATMRELWGPSPEPAPNGGRVRSIDELDIAELIDGHVRAASAALSAGVDGIECMFAYDTLVDGFLSDARNARDDDYGGSLENRSRLGREILERLRELLGPDPVLGFTISSSLPSYVDAAVALVDACDVDYVGVGNGDYDNLHLLIPPTEVEPGFGVPFAAAVRGRLPSSVLVIAEGRINDPAIAEHALQTEACDLAGMTRALIADPELPRKAAHGRAEEIRPCVADNLCIARRLRKFPIACLQNPNVGFEAEPPRDQGETERLSVIVVGGGLAGLEAARTCAVAGHAVRLYEEADTLGGQVLQVASLPRQEELRALVTWREREIERLDVDVRLGTQADASTIAAESPSIVVVATGSRPQPRRNAVVGAVDLLRGPLPTSGEVIVVDEEGHRKGVGTAEVLARSGCSVLLVTRNLLPAAALDDTLSGQLWRDALRAANVTIVNDARIANVHSDGATLVDVAGRENRVRASLVVDAGTHFAVDDLVAPLRLLGLPTIAVGDARAPRGLHDAIWDGARVSESVERLVARAGPAGQPPRADEV
ncbi:MAG: NAD(P)-binding protein [Actinobacteria bacterium]|nr:NAD(P)-binding protein [Actinomycetota bacterium]